MTEQSLTSAERGRSRDVLSLAVTGALLSAAIYLGVAGYRHFIQHFFVPMSRDGVWMSPLSYLFFFLIAALPLAALAGRMTRAGAVRAATVLSVWLVVFAILLPQTSIHRLAAAVLAAGCGVAVARVFSRRLDTWLARTRMLRRGLVVLLTAVAVVGVAYRTWSTKRAYAALPALADGSAPNVLLIILDTVRAASLSLYGYDRQTSPHLDDFAKNGVVFDWAMSASPWTLPSHASIFTGQYVGRLSTGFLQTLDAKEPTLAELFQAKGYETLGIIANQHYTAWDSGLNRGFLQYSDFPRTLVQLLKSSWYGQTVIANELYRATSRQEVFKILKQFKMYVTPKPEGDDHSATEVTDELLAWHAKRQPRPFFAFLNYFDAHAPYKPLPAWRYHFTKTPKSKDLYESDIAYIDSEVGRLLRTLDERGALKNTLVIITSDHGEQFGEHKMFGHGNSVYLPLLHVPLVIVQPGRVPAGARVQRTVSLRDLAPTIAQLTGLDSIAHFPGASLAPFWTDSTARGSAAIAELYRADELTPPNDLRRSRQFALLNDSLHFVWRTARKPELYVYRGDVAEVGDRAKDAEGARELQTMEALLKAEISRDTLRTVRRQNASVALRPVP